MDLEGIMLSEISQTEKDKYEMILSYMESKNRNKQKIAMNEQNKTKTNSQIQRTVKGLPERKYVGDQPYGDGW